MAKMFYTMEEAKAALGRTEDEIKTLTREGKLREFRDGPRLMFKADQVDALKGSLPPKDTIDIADSGAPISLVDSKGGSSAGSRAGSAGPMSIKDDTSVGEIGIGGSRAGSRAGSASGINIFNADDSETVDPSAATAITPASESANLEAVGSGSGLLDLTRESDDTSLGAVLDEIQPGKRDPGGSRAGSGSVAAAAAVAGAGATVRVAPAVVTRADPMAPFFGGLALGGVVIALLALLVLSGAVNGAQLGVAKQLGEMGFLVMLGIFLGVSLVCGAIGFGVGKVLK